MVQFGKLQTLFTRIHIHLIVIGAGLWSASLGLSLQPKRPCVLLSGMVPAGLEPSTGLLGLVGYLGVDSWCMG